MSGRSADFEYPRTGLPLLARSLHRAFKATISHGKLSTGERSTPVGQLDSRFWRSHTSKDAEVVLTAVTRRLREVGDGKDKDAQSVLQRARVPTVVDRDSLLALPWSTFLRHELGRQRLDDPLTLSRFSAFDLLHRTWLGPVRMLELFAVFQMYEPKKRAEAAKLPDGHQWHTTPAAARDILKTVENLLGEEPMPWRDIRFGELIRTLPEVAPTLNAALHVLRSKGIRHPSGSPSPWPEVERTLRAIRTELKALARAPLEQQLIKAVTPVLKTARSIDMFALRMGWKDGRRRTLADSGSELGNTREAIRRRGPIAYHPIQGYGLYCPKLTRAIALAQQLAPCTDKTLGAALRKEKLTSTAWTAETLIATADFLDAPHRMCIQGFEEVEWLSSMQNQRWPERVRSMARRSRDRDGRIIAATVAKRLAEQIKEDLAPQEVSFVLDAQPDIQWIDRDRGHFKLTWISR